jgi:hypothetical protein
MKWKKKRWNRIIFYYLDLTNNSRMNSSHTTTIFNFVLNLFKISVETQENMREYLYIRCVCQVQVKAPIYNI